LRGDNLGSITSTLLRLLDRYGCSEVTIAVSEAMKRGVPHPNAVRQTLQKRQDERHELPPIAVSLPNDKRVRDINVKTHDLEDYDYLKQQDKKSKEDKNND